MWCCLVWCGVAWLSVVWHGLVRRGVAWCDIVWCDMGWCSVHLRIELFLSGCGICSQNKEKKSFENLNKDLFLDGTLEEY